MDLACRDLETQHGPSPATRPLVVSAGWRVLSVGGLSGGLALAAQSRGFELMPLLTRFLGSRARERE